MKVNVFLTMMTLLLSVTVASFAQTVNNTNELEIAIANAKKGQTITLGVGTFAIGNIALPDGVSLKGSGYKATVIDSGGYDFGITSARNAAISDITIASASQVGIKLADTAKVTIERLMVRNSSTALLVSSCSEINIYNFIGAYNYAGTNFLDSDKVNFINNSIVYTESTSIRVNRCTNSAFFNNLFSFSATGINTIEPNTNTVIDHNFYIASKLGKQAGDNALRRKVEGWSTLTGHDKYSYTATLTFKDAKNYDFRPTSKVSWAPIWATTSDKGIATLNKVKAPALDIDGNKRIGLTDIGAYEISFDAPRKEDGTFTVKTGRVVSAGLFDEKGKLVNYLFNNELLKPGKYKYWLPSTTFEGKEVLPGKYTLKIVESNLDLKYVSSAGNGDSKMSKIYFGSPKYKISLDVQAAIFNNNDNLIISQTGFESGEFIRSYSDDLSHLIWSYSGGGNALGTAINNENDLYILRNPGTIFRVNSMTGKDVPFSNGSVSVNYDDTLKNVEDMTWLNGKVYVAANNAVVVLEDKELVIEKTIDAVSPTAIASDTENNRLYVISNNAVMVSTNNGDSFTTLALDVVPTLISASNGRFAIYSNELRKVYIYDVKDLNDVKLLTTIGTGDDGYGKITAERFWGPRYIALAKDGRVAVIDTPRTLVFDVNGKNLIMHGGMWGQAISYGFFNTDGNNRARFFNINSGYDIVIDNKTNDWEYGTRWKFDVENPNPIFYYSVGNSNFGIFRESTPGEGDGIAIKSMDTNSGIAKTIARYFYRGGKLYYHEDNNNDGILDGKDTDTLVLESNGEQVTARLFDAYFYNTDTQRDGSIFMPTHTPVYIKMTGLKNGVPQYDIAGRKTITLANGEKNTFVSPYDFKTDESLAVRGDMGVNPDLSFVAAIGMRSGAGPCPATEHAGSTDMAGYSVDGELRWVRAMNPVGMRMGMHGITNIQGITVAGRGMICEYEMFDASGLGLGTIGSPDDMGWHGMWIDNHRQLVGYIGNDNKPYIIVGDYASQSYHLMEVLGIDKVQYQNIAVTINDAKANELKASDAISYPQYPVPPPPSIVVKKLDHEMEIDGDLDKWRAITALEPLVISSENPANNSAVIRMGYTEKGIYVSIIKFDDKLVFHQTEVGKHYLQDGIEMNINTFWSSWKYNITRLNWSDDICWRDRFMGPTLGTDKLLDRDILPLNLQVFDNSDVSERKILEAASGVDMSKCQMMIIEFLLTPEALEGTSPKVELESGKGFILGFSINDNDRIGADSFEGLISWPANYGAFSRENDLATVTLE